MKRLAALALGTTRLLVALSTLALIGCGASPTQPSAATIPTAFTATAGAQVLIDASKDGGVWWFPQSETFDPNANHQGKALADTIRARGFTVDELPRGARVTPALVANYRLIVRVGSCASYASSELTAYDNFVARADATLWLLTDHMNGGCTRSDPLAGRYGGITYAGGETLTITKFIPHAITAAVTQLHYNAGATVTAFDPARVDLLATSNVTKRGVMGIIKGSAARIFFMGDSNCVQSVPQPLMNNLITWSFGLD